MKKFIFYNDKVMESNLNTKEAPALYLQKIDKKMKVDINKLLNRVKIDQNTEKKKNFIFFSFGILLLSLTGIFVTIIK